MMAELRPRPALPRSRALLVSALGAALAALQLDWGATGVAAFVGPADSPSPRSDVAMQAHNTKGRRDRRKFARYDPPTPRPKRTFGNYEEPWDRPWCAGGRKDPMWNNAFRRKIERQMGLLNDEDDEMSTSVFDGPRKDNEMVAEYRGRNFIINTDDWTYKLANPDDSPGWPESGIWSKDFEMPMEGKFGFLSREPELRKAYARKCRKLRKKHGMGQRWPNGKLIYLAKMEYIPFTREKFGDAYAGKAPWHFSPKEIEAREVQLRAYALKRRLEQEAEMMRLARLKDLGVFVEEQEWRRPWMPRVDVLTGQPLPDSKVVEKEQEME